MTTNHTSPSSLTRQICMVCAGQSLRMSAAASRQEKSLVISLRVPS